MIARDANVEFVQCPLCSTKVCFRCKDAYHKGITCEQRLDKMFKQSKFALKKNVSFCPMCKTTIEKNQGCNHMQCYFCHYEFCWVCQREATEDSGHWDKFNLRGCGAEQLDSTLNRKDLERIQSKKIGTFVFILMCFPFIIMFFVPHLLTSIFLD